ncbi:MAG: site-specific DNA-methyltransferase [Alphaproteobacteria bacterium]|nr:site-specific DNA-methyltransferase [Alphaproteobacteria bacterium]
MTFEHVKIGNDIDLYFGDNLEVMRSVKPPIDTLIADHPYKMNTSGGGKFRAERSNLEDITAAGLDGHFDIEVYHYAMKLGCLSLVCFFNWQQEATISAFFNHGHFFRNSLNFWDKTNASPMCNGAYQSHVEYFRHGWREGFRMKNRPLGDMKKVFTSANGKSEFDHPTVKPIDLMCKIVRNASHRGQLVIDPYMGTGSTGVACVQLGRRFVGIEHNRKFFDIAVGRLTEAFEAQQNEKQFYYIDGCDRWLTPIEVRSYKKFDYKLMSEDPDHNTIYRGGVSNASSE